MRHGYFHLRLGARFDAAAAAQTENVRNADAFDLDRLPDFETHRSAFELHWLVALGPQIFEGSPCPSRTDGNLL